MMPYKFFRQGCLKIRHRLLVARRVTAISLAFRILVTATRALMRHSRSVLQRRRLNHIRDSEAIEVAA